eukprot:gene9916-20616_t
MSLNIYTCTKGQLIDVLGTSESAVTVVEFILKHVNDNSKEIFLSLKELNTALTRAGHMALSPDIGRQFLFVNPCTNDDSENDNDDITNQTPAKEDT